ncbi:hypothetical protein UlMin_001463 [Ulmus minor]
MDPVEQSLGNQIATMTRVLAMAKIFREENYPSTIEENLFLGVVAVANNKSALKDLNITHILNVTNCGCSAASATSSGHEWSSGRSSLIDCRPVTLVVVAYLMKKYRMTVSQALEYVRSICSRASPNASFIIQLQEFELCKEEEN